MESGTWTFVTPPFQAPTPALIERSCRDPVVHVDEEDVEPRYRDPLPDVLTSAGLSVAGAPVQWRGGLAEPDVYLCGKWTERNWRNVPGPLYGAQMDTCWASREYAPHNISYEAENGQEFLFRQPRSRAEVLGVLCGASNDPFSGWGFDGDEHWNLELVPRLVAAALKD